MTTLALWVLTAQYIYRINERVAMRRIDTPTPMNGDRSPDDTTALIDQISEYLLRDPDVPESFKEAIKEPGMARQLLILSTIALAKTEGNEPFAPTKKSHD
jgi:hypothetical protein